MKKYLITTTVVGLLAFCSNSYSQNPPYIPGSAESAGLTRIVPDTLVWFRASQKLPKIGGFISGDDVSPGGSVEAGARLLGDSTFLLAASLKSTNDSTLMCRNLVLIPAAGGSPKLDSELYDDSGQIYLLDSNTVRQDGNPGRVGGDMRYGAVNYMTSFEATLFNFPGSFNSDGRFNNTFFNTLAGDGTARTFAGQHFRLNPTNLAVTPLNKALDIMFYPEHTNDVPVLGQQTGRSGSSPLGLANGNFVVVGEDRSRVTDATSGNVAVGKIYKADGTIVKPAWQISPVGSNGSMWDNVGAWRGGFFVKPQGGIAYCYDNDGNLQGSIDVNATADVSFATDRSDGTRFCSDIRSHYIFAAGKSPEGGLGVYTNIMLCAWDANTRTFITNTIVSDQGDGNATDLGGFRTLDRCNIACDAYNRVTVAYRYRPDNSVWGREQIVARVYSFNGTNFTPLTPNFFAFIQYDGTNNATPVDFESKEPSVAMTPREILIYAEGLWNGIPDSTNAPSSALDTHCYTILGHPSPIAKQQPQMTIAYSSPNSTISWQADAGLFVLQSASDLTGASWADVSPQPAITRTAYVDPNDKYQMSVPNGAAPKYYRLIRRW